MNTETLKGKDWTLKLSVDTRPATTANLYYDDTQRRPWSFDLIDDDGTIVYESKSYRTKAAAASVAARKLKT